MPLRGDEIAAALIARGEKAMLETINSAAEAILARSAVTAPRGDPEEHILRQERAYGADYPEKQLFESGEVRPATPDDPVAQVVYPGPYAAAQEVGAMTYESKGGKEVLWEPLYYTTPGTGPHYLEDAAKIIMAQLPAELQAQARIAYEA